MEVNGESIYGTNRTRLPIQPWGVTTMKGSKIYLHVFHWPADGNLIVGRLKSDVMKAWLLSDEKKRSLVIKRLDDSDLTISGPRQAPDSINSVIVLQCKAPVMVTPVRLLSTKIKNCLLAFDAELHGHGLRFGDGKADRYYVYHWNKPEQWVSWKFRTISASKYRITAKYQTDHRNKGSVYKMELAGRVIEKKVQSPEDLGIVNVPKGQGTLVTKPVSIEGGELMKLFEIDMEPVK